MPRRSAPLSDLADQARRADGFPTLVERTAAAGQRLSLSYLHALANVAVERMPDEPRLNAIAAALQMPYEIVWLAAVVQWMPAAAEPLKSAMDGLLASQLQAYEHERNVADALRTITAAHEHVAEQRRQGPRSA